MGKDSFARSTVAYQIQRDVLPSLEAQIIKKLPASAGDLSLIPGSGRCPGGGNGSPLQYSCLGNLLEEEPGGLQSMGSQKNGTQLYNGTTTTTKPAQTMKPQLIQPLELESLPD